MEHSSSEKKRLEEVNSMLGDMLSGMSDSYHAGIQTEESAINEAEDSIRREIGLKEPEREAYLDNGQLRWRMQIGERKIRAVWSPELVEDLKAYHSIDAAAELSAMLLEEIKKDLK